MDTKSSDYITWTPPWGLLTEQSIKDLFDKYSNFTMKDGSIVHLKKMNELKSFSIKWTTENPGGQLFTGSFHPLNDSMWEDRSSWDIRVRPKEPRTFPEIFTLR